jgi:hypothetical protein
MCNAIFLTTTSISLSFFCSPVSITKLSFASLVTEALADNMWLKMAFAELYKDLKLSY